MTMLNRSPGRPDERAPTIRVGLVAAPELPAQVADELAEQLPELLEREHDGRGSVALADEPLLAGREGLDEILDAGSRARSAEGWVFEDNAKQAAGIGPYAGLAWLGAAIGTVGGALGSKLENIDEVRQATYGHNQCRRRASTG